MSSDTEQHTHLPEALAIAQPLVTWLLRSGVGYSEFVAALKPLFLAQAQRELEASGQKSTDSALSLLSGLHRKDVRALRESASADLQATVARRGSWGKPSVVNQLATRWMADPGWPDTLPFSGTERSFETLAQSISRDVHPRALLQELQRLGLVVEQETCVTLVREAFVPDPHHEEARKLMAGAVSDHLQAGVHNLTTDSQGKFLEQSVFADGLSPASVQQLNLLANTLWKQVMQQVVEAATPLCEQDANHPEPHRFRLGLFSYTAPEAPQSPQSAANSAHEESQ